MRMDQCGWEYGLLGAGVCALTDLQRREELRACDEQEVEVEKVAELLVENFRDEREERVLTVEHAVARESAAERRA